MGRGPRSRADLGGEPSVRRDGRCLVCGEERPPVAVSNRDPFCSTACSRKHHGVVDVWVAAQNGH